MKKIKLISLVFQFIFGFASHQTNHDLLLCLLQKIDSAKRKMEKSFKFLFCILTTTLAFSFLNPNLANSAPLIQYFHVQFGAVPVRQSVTVALSFGSNINAVSQNVGVAVQSGSTDFAIENDGCSGASIPTGSVCYFDVVFTPSSPGVKTGLIYYDWTNVYRDPITGSSSNGSGTVNYQLSGATPNQANVFAQSVRPAQVIYNPRLSLNSPSTKVDIVQGKSMSFEVTLGAGNNQSSTDSVIVQVADLNGKILSHSKSPIQVSSIGSGFKIRASDMTAYLPLATGSLPIKIQFDAKLAPNTTTTPLVGTILNIVKTYTPSVGVIQFGDCNGPDVCYGAASNNNLKVLLGQQNFVSDIFPIADNSLKLSPTSVVFNGSPDKTGLNLSRGSDKGISEDLLNLGFKKVVLGFQRLVAIVPAGYFPYHLEGFDAAGVTPHFGSVSFVNELAVGGTLPHELGHGLGTIDLYDPRTRIYTGPYEDGFNARTNTATFHLPSFMGPDLGTISKLWIDSTSYSSIFKSLLKPPIDPDVIVVSGLLSDTGTFTFGPSKELLTGIFTQSVENGDIKVSALDSNNVEISSVSLKSDFTASVSYFNGGLGPASLEMSSIPVVVALQYDSHITSFQISQNGKTVAKTFLNAAILLEIIQSIPDNAFRLIGKRGQDDFDDDTKNDIVTRVYNIKKHLLKEVASIQNELNSRENKKAKHSLEKLEEKIKRLTYENYTFLDATQSSQQQVISELQSIIKKIEISKDDHD